MHSIKADTKKNRLYVKLIDKTYNDEAEKTFQMALSECKKLKPGFTCLTDLREYQVVSNETVDMIKKMQIILKDAGMSKAVRVQGTKSIREFIQFEVGSMEAGYSSYTVKTIEEAEAILNDIIQQ